MFKGMIMIRIELGDITKLAVDAIVNAANQIMLGGGGVDGAIHRAAGKELFEACLKVSEVCPGVRCPTGEARITPGFKLPAKFVIHTVGPVYRDGQHGEPEKLAGCYRNSLAVAIENGCRSIAFPCISTGVYGYPVRDAAEIAVREVRAVLVDHTDLEVVFCCFSERDVSVYEDILRQERGDDEGNDNRTLTSREQGGPAKNVKCVVWDLDDTLWKGVYAEGNTIVPHLRPNIVEIIKELDSRGILNSIASRNEFEVVSDALKSVGLWEYFLIPQINWGAKSFSLATIATELGLGLDSFAFIDDDVREREEVTSQYPFVRTYDPAQIDNLLSLPEFAVTISATSAERRQMYIEELQRRKFRDTKEGSNEEFLKGLCLELTFRDELTDCIAERAAELLSRANNYHMTGNRYWTARKLLDVQRCSDMRILTCDLQDRFGSYGCVGVVLLELKSGQDIAFVRELAMSCRAASKTVDVALIRMIASYACGIGGRSVRFRLVETNRNAPLRRFLWNLPGGVVSMTSDGFDVGVDVKMFLNAKVDCFAQVHSTSVNARKVTMKTKSGYSIKELGDRCYLTADNSVGGPALVVLNTTGRYIWELLQTERTEDDVIQCVADRFGLQKEDVRHDVNDFLHLAIEAGIVEESI